MNLSDPQIENRSRICLRVPSRLHFGLFSVGFDTTQQFGGVGLMIDDPATRIRLEHSNTLSVQGREPETTVKIVERWFQQYGDLIEQCDAAGRLPVSVNVESTPPRHSGFGSGTQLTLGIAAGLFRFFNLPIPKPEELAPAMGRGGRSGIGSHGFYSGGLIVDRGKEQDQHVAPLDFRTDFPDDWRIVLMTMQISQGLSGKLEKSAFANLPSTSVNEREKMIEMVRNTMIPSVLAADYEPFAESVYRLSHHSGLIFASVQGGPYNGPEVTELVGCIRDFGVPAVGQSSWGPCVFAVTPDDNLAEALREFVNQKHASKCIVQISKANNSGASWS